MAENAYEESKHDMKDILSTVGDCEGAERKIKRWSFKDLISWEDEPYACFRRGEISVCM